MPRVFGEGWGGGVDDRLFIMIHKNLLLYCATCAAVLHTAMGLHYNII